MYVYVFNTLQSDVSSPEATALVMGNHHLEVWTFEHGFMEKFQEVSIARSECWVTFSKVEFITPSYKLGHWPQSILAVSFCE